MSTSRKDRKGRVLRTGESVRSDGRYMYRWTDINKRRQCEYADTLNELRKKEEEINNEIASGILRTGTTLNQQIEFYLKTKANVSVATSSNYTYYYHHSIENSFLGKMSMKDIKKAHILAFYKDCHDNGMANSTIAILQKVIRPSLQLAVDSDFLRKNPATGCLKDYPVEEEVKYAMSFEEENEFLARFDICIDARFYKPLACILLYTGMRISELLGLTWDDVDMKKRTIDINHQMLCRNLYGKFVQYCRDNTKTENGTRVIPMNDMAYQYMLEQKKHWLACKKVPDFSIDGYSNFVFLSYRTGKVVRHAVIRRLFRKLVREYNETREVQLPAISPHILRHTYCTRLAEAGTDLKTMQYLMGHSDIKTTMEVYNHVDQDRLERELHKINDLHQVYANPQQSTSV